MPGHIFTYRGKELAKPLKDLISFLEPKTQQLENELRQTPAIRSPLPALLRDADYKDPGADIQRKLENVKSNKLKATNWLRECERKPWAKYQLDEAEVHWLYSYKNPS